MNKIVFIITLFFTSILSANTYFHPYVNYKYNKLNFQYPYQVVIQEDIPYRPYSKEVKDIFFSKIVKFSYEYRKYAKERGINRPLPFTKFVFKIGFNKLGEKAKNFTGYCDSRNNIIYLNAFFNIRTFFHELGHCDLGYSHKHDSDVVKTGKSRYLMNWNFDPEYYKLSMNDVLDDFFNHKNHFQLHTIFGLLAHASMVEEKKVYNKRNNKAKNKKILKAVAVNSK